MYRHALPRHVALPIYRPPPPRRPGRQPAPGSLRSVRGCPAEVRSRTEVQLRTTRGGRRAGLGPLRSVRGSAAEENGRAHVRTTVTNANHVCRHLLAQKNKYNYAISAAIKPLKI